MFTFPYQLWFNKTDPTWGFSFNHANPGDRGYGPADGPSSAVEYYVNGIYVNSLSFSASEFSAAKSTLELKNLAGQSVDAYFYANKAVSGASSGYLYSPLCLGMGFVSGVYNNLTPVYVAILYLAVDLSPCYVVADLKVQLQHSGASPLSSTAHCDAAKRCSKVRHRARGQFTMAGVRVREHGHASVEPGHRQQRASTRGQQILWADTGCKTHR